MPLKDNVLFLHVPRTGGSSVVKSMGIGEEENEDELYSKTHAFQHYTARMIANLGIEWNQVFTIVREPVSRLASEWYARYGYYQKLGRMKGVRGEDAFLQICKNNKNTFGHYGRFSSYENMFTGISNLRVLNFSSLASDWKKMVQEWELPWHQKLGYEEKTKSRGKIKLSYEVKQEIAELHKSDYTYLDNLGFKF